MAVSLLVLTNFLPAANCALSYADTLAQAIGAQLVLLYVRRDSVLDPEHLTGRVNTLNQEAIDEALASLTRQLPTPVLTEIGHGQVADAVAETLGRHQPALVVLGHRHTDNMADELVSTAALDILRAAPQPMLVVPQHAGAATVPRRVLLAVDAEPFGLGAHAGLVRNFFGALPAQLTVLHVSPTADPAATEAARAAVLRTGLAADLPPVAMLNLPHPGAAEGILQVGAGGEFDMVVLIARPRSFLGELFHRSVTAQVLLHSGLPVLVVPTQ